MTPLKPVVFHAPCLYMSLVFSAPDEAFRWRHIAATQQVPHPAPGA